MDPVGPLVPQCEHGNISEPGLSTVVNFLKENQLAWISACTFLLLRHGVCASSV